MSDVHLASFVL